MAAGGAADLYISSAPSRRGPRALALQCQRTASACCPLGCIHKLRQTHAPPLPAGVAPQHQLRQRRHLPRRPEGPVEPRADAENSAAQPAGGLGGSRGGRWRRVEQEAAGRGADGTRRTVQACRQGTWLSRRPPRLPSLCVPPLQALLSSPQPDDPQDAVVARQYLGSLAEYQATAKQWTDTYAHKASRWGCCGRLLLLRKAVSACCRTRSQLPCKPPRGAQHVPAAPSIPAAPPNAPLLAPSCSVQQQVVGLEAKVQVRRKQTAIALGACSSRTAGEAGMALPNLHLSPPPQTHFVAHLRHICTPRCKLNSIAGSPPRDAGDSGYGLWAGRGAGGAQARKRRRKRGHGGAAWSVSTDCRHAGLARCPRLSWLGTHGAKTGRRLQRGAQGGASCAATPLPAARKHLPHLLPAASLGFTARPHRWMRAAPPLFLPLFPTQP